MKKFVVSIPITGAIHVEVEATTEAAARESAWCKVDDEGEEAGELEWEFCEQVTQGNVCYAMLNEVETSEVKP